MSPAPSDPALATSTVNSTPPCVGPQGGPSSAASTEYEPPPASTTWNVVFAKPASQSPA